MSKVQSINNVGTDHPRPVRLLTSEHSNALLAIAFIGAWLSGSIR
jgi:hypothetical protein